MQFKVAGALRRHHVSVPGARWRAGFVRARGTEQGTIRADLGVAIAVMAPTGQATNCTHARSGDRRQRPRRDPTLAAQGVSARPGRNAAIVHAFWGTTKAYSTDKTPHTGKLSLAVPTLHASQRCDVCGHVNLDHMLRRPCSLLKAAGPRTTPMRTPSLCLDSADVVLLGASLEHKQTSHCAGHWFA